MSNPVLQGIVSPSTNFIVTDLSSSSSPFLPTTPVPVTNSNQILSYSTDVELKDNLITNLIPHSLDLQHSRSYFPLPDLTGGDRSKSGEETEEESIGSVDDEDLEEAGRQGETVMIRRVRKEEDQGVKFYPIALEEPLPISVWQPRPKEKDDLHMRVVINTAELANLGCLSGSWVSLSEKIKIIW